MRLGTERRASVVPDSVVRTSGFTVFVFMTPAWLGGPGQHIRKIPGVAP
jgi:hypothetical protein